MPSPAWRDAFNSMWVETDEFALVAVIEALRVFKIECRGFSSLSLAPNKIIIQVALFQISRTISKSRELVQILSPPIMPQGYLCLCLPSIFTLKFSYLHFVTEGGLSFMSLQLLIISNVPQHLLKQEGKLHYVIAVIMGQHRCI